MLKKMTDILISDVDEIPNLSILNFKNIKELDLIQTKYVLL